MLLLEHKGLFVNDVIHPGVEGGVKKKVILMTKGDCQVILYYGNIAAQK